MYDIYLSGQVNINLMSCSPSMTISLLFYLHLLPVTFHFHPVDISSTCSFREIWKVREEPNLWLLHIIVFSILNSILYIIIWLVLLHNFSTLRRSSRVLLFVQILNQSYLQILLLGWSKLSIFYATNINLIPNIAIPWSPTGVITKTELGINPKHCQVWLKQPKKAYIL